MRLEPLPEDDPRFAVLTSMFDAWGRGERVDMPAHADYVMVPPPEWPESEPIEGIEEAWAFFETWRETLDPVFELVEVGRLGADLTLTTVGFEFRGQTSGLDLGGNRVYRLDRWRDGRLARTSFHMSEAEALAATEDLSHLDVTGRARMVDVGGKDVTDRRAVARAELRMSAATAAAVARGDAPKGDVIGTARLAGIQAAKRTDELIPLCHPLPLSFIDVSAETSETGIVLTAEARTSARTGVEMEAMTAACVAALTVYDMVKGLERGVELGPIVLLEKTGGKEDWRRE